MTTLLAQVSGYSLGQLLIAIIVVAACLGIVIVAVRAFGLQIPDWVWSILGIIAVAVVAILALRFVLSL